MATVRIPSLMRALTDGQERVKLPGQTVGELIAALERRYPGVRDRLCQGDQIDPAIAVWIDGRIAKLGLPQSVDDHAEVLFMPAAAGG